MYFGTHRRNDVVHVGRAVTWLIPGAEIKEDMLMWKDHAKFINPLTTECGGEPS
jgi:hypothetical protein